MQKIVCTPQQWINLVQDLEEMWTQKRVAGPTDRVLMIWALFKGKSVTVADVTLDEALQALVSGELAHQILNIFILKALNLVEKTIFSHGALKLQCLWMNKIDEETVQLAHPKKVRRSQELTTLFHFSPGG